MLDHHDEIEKQGLQAMTKVLQGLGGAVVLILGVFYGVERGACGIGFIPSNRIVFDLQKRTFQQVFFFNYFFHKG